MKGGFRLNIEIHDKKVKKIIEDSDKLIKKIGIEMARKLKQRINEITSIPNFKEYLEYGPGKPHPLTGDLNNMYGIHLNKNYRLVVEPLVNSRDSNSLVECKNINIKGVVEYHGDKKEWIIP